MNKITNNDLWVLISLWVGFPSKLTDRSNQVDQQLLAVLESLEDLKGRVGLSPHPFHLDLHLEDLERLEIN